MDLTLEENLQNLIIPIELTKIIYSEYDAELTILDKPGQVEIIKNYKLFIRFITPSLEII